MAMTASGLGGRLTVDLAALARNWRALDKVSNGALTGAVVKADAYGTGIIAAASAFYSAGARFFFTATLDEAVAVRTTVPQAHVFVLNGVYPGAAELYAREKLMPVISSLAMLEEWLSMCIRRNEAVPAALHFDTGMNRLGFKLSEASIVKRHIDDLGFAPQMIMSHLACADQPSHEKNRTQLALFHSVMGQFPGVPASLANSAGLMTSRDTHFQMVRPGIALYGGRAVAGRRNPMSPVVTLEAPILMVRDARTGESVGYGATQALARDSRLAVVGIGYADGLMRSLSSSSARPGGKMAVNGRVCPIVGRISMDTTVIDITDLPEPPLPGEMAEVIGPNVPLDDQAEVAGTIGYELLTGLSGRYARRYVENGAPPR